MLLLGAAGQEGSVRQWIEELGSDSIEVREKATRKLLETGATAKPYLEAAAATSDPEVSARARCVLNRLFPLRIAFDFDPARGDATKPLSFSIAFVATDEGGRLFHPAGLSYRVELLELRGEARGCCSWLRGSGRWSSHCLLSDSDFVRLDPDEAHESRQEDVRGHSIEVSQDVLRKNPESRNWALGWPGRYRVTAEYRFSRKAYRDQCDKGCSGHDDPSMPWNRCPEASLRAQAEFVIVRGPERCPCGKSIP